MFFVQFLPGRHEDDQPLPRVHRAAREAAAPDQTAAGERQEAAPRVEGDPQGLRHAVQRGERF